MPTESNRGSRNAFTADFLNRLDETAEPDGAHEADVAGPWAVRPVRYGGGTGFAVLREWESLDEGDLPYAVFRRREMALLAAAVLPATGREPLLRLATEPDAAGFPLHSARMPDPGPLEPVEPLEPLQDAAADHAAGADDAADAEAAAGADPVRPLRSPRSPCSAGAQAAQPSRASRSLRESTGEPAGHLRDFDEALAGALNLAAALVRSPVSLAALLQAAGHVALEQAGRILHRRIH
jgi:hypothetical protein